MGYSPSVTHFPSSVEHEDEFEEFLTICKTSFKISSFVFSAENL